jgi:drug/metabolite transporter (DMT)-like permease
MSADSSSSTITPIQSPAIPPILGILIGVIAVSFAAVFIRYASAGGAPALAIAAWRLSLATLILAIPAWFQTRDELRGLTRRDLGLALLSGTFLAGHFATWISSLELTSVASSVALVTMYPLFAAVVSALWLGERLQWIGWVGVVLSVIGSVIVAFADVGAGGNDSLLGNGLALAGAVTGAGYFLVGRRLRAKLSLIAYITLTYGTAAVVLIIVALVARVPLFGYSPTVYLMFLLLAAVPQLIGHSSFNWALRYLSATFVTVTVVGEPIGASILAVVLFGERPGWIKVAAGALILIGIVLTSRAEGQKSSG